MARRRKKKKGGKGIVFILFLIIIIAAAVLLYKSTLNYNDVFKPGDTDYYPVSIPSGTTGQKIAEMLEEQGIIKDSLRFRLKAKLTKQDSLFQAGNFLLSPSMSTEEIFTALKNAKGNTVRFTVPEGLYLRQVAETLCQSGLISNEEDFYKALEDDYNYDFIPNEAECNADPTGTLNARQNRLEGFLFPNTYEVYEGASAHDIINRMLSGFNDVYGDLYRNKQKELGLSFKDVITIASLIEREALYERERADVASVIYNRLNAGMKLQLDASIQYCLGKHTDRVLYKDLEIKSPYNTYLYEGIAAGPIASPGESSIYAALFPANTNYYYYVLKPDGSGYHNFAENYKDFQYYNSKYKDSL